MYKLLIIDDNYMQIQSLLHYIDWKKFGIVDIETAQDGKEGLGIFKTFLPDIVITDVLMPELNGIELSKEIKKIKKNTKIIFISCCEEFDYLKEAMEIDAVSYILKPIDPKILEDNLYKLIDQIEHEKKYESMSTLLKESMEAYRKNFFYRLIYSKYINQDYLNNIIHNLEFDQYKQFIIAKLELLDVKDRFIDIYNLLNLTESYLFVELDGMTVVENETRMVVMYMTESDNTSDFLKKTRETLLKYSEISKKEYNINFSIGLSDVHSSLNNYSLLFDEANCALQNNLSFKDGGIYSYTENDFMQPTLNIFDIKDALDDLLTSNENNKLNTFIDLFYPKGSYANYYSVKIFSVYVFTTLQILLTERNLSNEKITKELKTILEETNKIDKLADIKLWLSNRLQSIFDAITTKEESEHEKIIREIEFQINNNYNKISCMDQIATNLFISESYARKIYKQFTGKTIFESLFEKRMEKAKELLVSKPEMRVYEIASAVGYKSKQYFIEAFKRSEGCIPKDYRQKYLLEKK